MSFDRRHGWIVTALALVIAGCTQPDAEQASVVTGTSAAEKDMRDAWLLELMDADREFSAMSAAEGAPVAFAAYADASVIMLPAGGAPIHGHSAMVAVFDGYTANLTWEPEYADVAASGDLGFTWGRYVQEREGEDGEPVLSYGKYVSIWRRQDDGSWKFVLDTGNESPAPGLP